MFMFMRQSNSHEILFFFPLCNKRCWPHFGYCVRRKISFIYFFSCCLFFNHFVSPLSFPSHCVLLWACYWDFWSYFKVRFGLVSVRLFLMNSFVLIKPFEFTKTLLFLLDPDLLLFCARSIDCRWKAQSKVFQSIKCTLGFSPQDGVWTLF